MTRPTMTRPAMNRPAMNRPAMNRPVMTRPAIKRHDRPAGLLTHPLLILAAAVLVANDHILKERHGNIATGKLSDVAGLALFPALMVAGIEMLAWVADRRPPQRAQALRRAGLLTGVVFAMVQTVPQVTELYRWVAGLPWGGSSSVVADVTDLLALPAVLAGWLLAKRLEMRSRGLPHDEQYEAGGNAYRQRQLRVGPLSE